MHSYIETIITKFPLFLLNVVRIVLRRNQLFTQMQSLDNFH